MNGPVHAERALSSIGRVQRSWQARRAARERALAGFVALASLVGTAAVVLAARGPTPGSAPGAALDSRMPGRSRGLPAIHGSFLEIALVLDGLALQYVANESGAPAPASTRPEPAAPGADFAGERRAVEKIGRHILRTLCGAPPHGGSETKPFDPWVAFERGWAAHFAALACDFPTYPAQAREEEERDLAAYDHWARRLDRESRTRPGAASLLYPLWTARYSWAASVRTVRSGVSAARLRDDVPLEPVDVVLDGDIVGAVLYSLVTDPRIQTMYREAGFYNRFRSGGASARGGPAEEFGPLENAYLKVFHVLARSVRPGPAARRRPPIVTLVDEYAKQFPDEAYVAYGAFLAATGGLTVDPESAGYPRAGDAARGAWAEERYRAILTRLRDDLVQGRVAPDATLRASPMTAAVAGEGGSGRPGVRSRASAAASWGGPFYSLTEVLRSLARRIALATGASGLAAIAAAATRRAVASRTPRPILIIAAALSAFLLAV